MHGILYFLEDLIYFVTHLINKEHILLQSDKPNLCIALFMYCQSLLESIACASWSNDKTPATFHASGNAILDAIKATVNPSTSVVYSENPGATFIKDNDLSSAIVVVGETAYAETKGGNQNLTLPAPGPSIVNTVSSAVK